MVSIVLVVGASIGIFILFVHVFTLEEGPAALATMPHPLGVFLEGDVFWVANSDTRKMEPSLAPIA
jgi:hypothetical protein